MAVKHLGLANPQNNSPVQILAESASFDYFLSVVCVNKGMGDTLVSVYAKALLDSEGEYMYFIKDQTVPGNTVFETKKMTLGEDHALYVKCSHPVVSFSCAGLKTDRI